MTQGAATLDGAEGLQGPAWALGNELSSIPDERHFAARL